MRLHSCVVAIVCLRRAMAVAATRLCAARPGVPLPGERHLGDGRHPLRDALPAAALRALAPKESTTVRVVEAKHAQLAS